MKWVRKIATVKEDAEKFGEAETLELATEYHNEIWTVVETKTTQRNADIGICTLFLFRFVLLSLDGPF
jgi:hypothetical protein